ncbi:MAG: hypothetical protein AB8B53_02885 [Flavobacteriales bacterium]
MYFRLLLFIYVVLSATNFEAQTSISLKANLSKINSEWSLIETAFRVEVDFNSLTEQQKIQLHLELVEKILGDKNTDHLSSDQRIKRQQCLSILNAYWNQGVFPINLYHPERTPYFIDHLGTHCAVGHLIAQSGHGQLADLIHKENNYGYLYDLAEHYSDIQIWAETHGFTLQELAWIQPGYVICSNECDQEIFMLVEVESGNEYVGEITFYWPDLDVTSGYVDFLCPDQAYTVIATDSEGTIVEDVDLRYWLVQSFVGSFPLSNGQVHTDASAGAQVEFSSTKSTGYCDGSASFELLNDVMLTDVTWLDYPENSGTELTGVCSGWYQVVIETNYQCLTQDSTFCQTQL